MPNENAKSNQILMNLGTCGFLKCSATLRAEYTEDWCTKKRLAVCLTKIFCAHRRLVCLH